MQNRIFLLVTSILSPVAFSASAQTQASRAVADHITEAYGGQKLFSLRALRIIDDALYSEYKYGFTPDFYEYDRSQSDLVVDFETSSGSFDYRVAGDRFAYHNRNLTTEDGIISVSYALGTFEPNAFESFIDAFGAPMRRSDTVIAYWIGQTPGELHVTGTSRYYGREHWVAEFDLPVGRKSTLFIDQSSGLITRMDRELWNGTVLRTVWADHAISDGITYASFVQVHYGDHLERV
ncbi:MAG: hypothetical protein AAF583_15000, partial [Pseudomonadota bacterium]